jgi:hypothetical protein
MYKYRKGRRETLYSLTHYLTTRLPFPNQVPENKQGRKETTQPRKTAKQKGNEARRKESNQLLVLNVKGRDESH